MRGEVVYLYAFDVAAEIRTTAVANILSEQPVPLVTRVDRTVPKSVPFYKPLSIELPPRADGPGGATVRVQVHVYDIGAVNITLRLAVDVADLHDLIPYHRPLTTENLPFDMLARSICTDVCHSIRDSLVTPTLPPEPEAYTLFCLTEMPFVDDLAAWVAANRKEIAGLLGECDPEVLSPEQVKEVFRIQRAYANSDVVVLDWDAALVIDLAEPIDDVIYVIEIANLQVEEFRILDTQLDRFLSDAYTTLGEPRFRFLGIKPAIIGALRRMRIDATRLTDEVTNISKFFGDWFLARVYISARDRFHLPQWQASVEQRLAQIDQLYGVVQSDVNEKRMLGLEMIIVLLFIADLALIFFHGR